MVESNIDAANTSHMIVYKGQKAPRHNVCEVDDSKYFVNLKHSEREFRKWSEVITPAALGQ